MNSLRTRPSFQSKLLSVFSVLIVGLLVGWFTGQTKSHEYVVAALLPAVLAALTALAASWQAEHTDSPLFDTVSYMVIFMAVGIFFGALIGTSSRDYYEDRNAIRNYMLTPSFLRKCSDRQFRINFYRLQLGVQELLTHDDVCPSQIPQNFKLEPKDEPLPPACLPPALGRSRITADERCISEPPNSVGSSGGGSLVPGRDPQTP